LPSQKQLTQQEGRPFFMRSEKCGLANLDQLPGEVEFIALPLNIIGGDGCPVRAIARELGR
jgi:kynurenine formamidase